MAPHLIPHQPAGGSYRINGLQPTCRLHSTLHSHTYRRHVSESAKAAVSSNWTDISHETLRLPAILLQSEVRAHAVNGHWTSISLMKIWKIVMFLVLKSLQIKPWKCFQLDCWPKRNIDNQCACNVQRDTSVFFFIIIEQSAVICISYAQTLKCSCHGIWRCSNATMLELKWVLHRTHNH